MQSDRAEEPLTYGSYLRVPELTSLQTPLAEPPVHDELLFIIGQQAQELWFKQILLDLQETITLLDGGELPAGTRLLDRVNRILRVLGAETEVLEMIAPNQFHRFRGILRAASGFESEQFRELELASGLRDESYLRMVRKVADVGAILARWPRSLHDVLRSALAGVDEDTTQAAIAILADPPSHPELHALVEAMSEYELRFQAWRFHHLQLVERVIGDRSPGTGGSAGSAYLSRTLGYRFFPELWEARNALSSRASYTR